MPGGVFLKEVLVIARNYRQCRHFDQLYGYPHT
jgi:hypothetical protein